MPRRLPALRQRQGAGNTDPEHVDPGLREIEQMIVEVAQSPGRPGFLEQPVYPARESETLLQVIRQVRQEKPDLPMAYQMVLTDLEQRIPTDRSRATMNVAASTLLAAATPALSSFLLEIIVAPTYQKANKPEIVKAVLAEAARSGR